MTASTSTASSLLHAFPLHAGMYSPLRALLDDSTRLLTPDMRGFGSAPLGDAAPSLDVLADDLVALLDAEGVDQAVVGGTSMGGYVAMAFARQHPERLSGLVLLDTKPSADGEQARAARHDLASIVESEQDLRVVRERVVPKLLGATTKVSRPDVVRAVDELVSEAAPDSVAWASRAMAARQDSLDVLRGLGERGLPSVVVVGSEDALASVDDAHAMATALGIEPVVVEGAGHLAPLERPEPVAAAIRELVRA